jgi:lysophospholipase L1-like esterase
MPLFHLTRNAALLSAVFVYGIGVGRYEWPPFNRLKAAYLDVADSNTSYYTARFSLFQSTPGSADVVMLGDSITEGGNWAELLPGIKVINRGIAGDTSSGVLARLSEVIARKPKLVFIMVGVNDLKRFESRPEVIAGNIKELVDRLQESHITPVVQSILFVGEAHKPDINPAIRQLNALLRIVASEASVPFLDVNAVLAPGGILADQFTYDGAHLTGAAYLTWRDVIMAQVCQ